MDIKSHFQTFFFTDFITLLRMILSFDVFKEWLVVVVVDKQDKLGLSQTQTGACSLHNWLLSVFKQISFGSLCIYGQFNWVSTLNLHEHQQTFPVALHHIDLTRT